MPGIAEDDLVVELHIPLEKTPGLEADEYQYPWIDEVESFLLEEDEDVYDDGEEVGDEYVFFVSDATEEELLALVARAAVLQGVPGGAYAVVAPGDESLDRRVDLT